MLVAGHRPPGRVAGEAEAELRFHEEVYAADLVRQGAAPEEAARRARLELGPPEAHGERYRSAVGLRAFDELGGDVRFGLRSLLRNPGYAAVGVLSLALGIGATTAMFSLMYAVLLHPFPYAGADRIMNPAIINEEEPSQLRWFALWKPQFAEFAKAQCIESLLGFRNKSEVLTGEGLPEDALAVYMTENAEQFFERTSVAGANDRAERCRWWGTASGGAELPVLAAAFPGCAGCDRQNAGTGSCGVHDRGRDATQLRLR